MEIVIISALSKLKGLITLIISLISVITNYEN